MSPPREDGFVPPQNLDAEESILGAMTLSPKAIEAAAEILDAGDFYRESHGTIYRAAVEMHGRLEPVDAITLTAELERRGLLEEVGGRSRIRELAALVPTTSNVAHYARIIRDAATNRAVIVTGGEIAKAGWEAGDPAEAIATSANLVAGLAERGRRAEAAAAFALPLDEFISARSESPAALIGETDDIVLPRGGLWILGGKAGVGKTTLMLDAALHLASGVEWLDEPIAEPLNVLLVENEGPREPFRRKLERKLASWPSEVRGSIHVATYSWAAIRFDDPAIRSALRAYVEARSVDVVIGDPLGSLGVEGVGSPADTRAFVDHLLALGLGRDLAFLLLHHFRKEPTAEEIDELSGSWAGHTDTVAILKTTAGDRLRLSFPKLRWGEKRPPRILAKLVETQGFEVVAIEKEKGSDETATLADRIADFLAENPGAATEVVAKGVRKRRVDVLAELESDPRFDELPQEGIARRWTLASVPVPIDGTGRDGYAPGQRDDPSPGPTVSLTRDRGRDGSDCPRPDRPVPVLGRPGYVAYAVEACRSEDELREALGLHAEAAAAVGDVVEAEATFECLDSRILGGSRARESSS